MQKTSLEKGGEYSSTGGHVVSGEDAITSIRREVEEELGIDVSKDNIVDYGFLLYDKPLRYLFYLKKDIDLEDKLEVLFFDNKIPFEKDEFWDDTEKMYHIIYTI